MLLPMLDVAIGLTFVYCLLSIVCSAVNEAIEAWLKVRASNLARGLEEMLDDPDLVKKLYQHPLIASLYSGRYTAIAAKNLAVNPAPTNLPSYIPSADFAKALVDILLQDNAAVPAATHAAATATESMAQANAARSLNDPQADQLQAAAEAAAARARLAGNPSVLIASSTLPATAKAALSSLANPPQVDLTKLQSEIENWFNSTMDRVSEWYKRRTQTFILGLAFALAVLLNVDTVVLLRTLSQNEEARAAMVAAALQRSQAESAAAAGAVNPLDPLQAAQQATKAAADSLNQAVAELDQAKLPIGWTASAWSALNERPLRWVNKLLGVLLTTFAISLGADFWFNLLNKFVSVRSSRKPERKPQA